MDTSSYNPRKVSCSGRDASLVRTTMTECDYCNGEMLTVTGCNQRTYTIDGHQYNPEPVDTDSRECHDCGAMTGEFHHPGCDMERCPLCRGQLISCGHGRQAFQSLEGDE